MYKRQALLDRLTLTEERISGIAKSVREVIALPDPLGRILETILRPNGLKIEKISVPVGVIGVIYEARPNVTADSAALCLKSGNAVIPVSYTHLDVYKRQQRKLRRVFHTANRQRGRYRPRGR